MPLDIQGTVTRRSNGTIAITPAEGSPATEITIAEAALGSKQLPQMGDTVTVSIAVSEKVQPAEPAATAASVATAADSEFSGAAPTPNRRKNT